MREQGVDAGAVQVIHARSGRRRTGRRSAGGQAERVAEPVGVAHVDLADRGHDRGAVGARRVESSSGVAIGDPHVHVDGGAGRAGLDGDLLHQGPHQRDAVPAVCAVPGRRGPPAAGVGNGQAQLVRGRDRPQPDLLAGQVTVAVLDRVGAGLAGRDQDVLGQSWCRCRSCSASCGAWPAPGRAGPIRRRTTTSSGSGMVVEHDGHVVLVTPGGGEPRHEPGRRGPPAKRLRRRARPPRRRRCRR